MIVEIKYNDEIYIGEYDYIEDEPIEPIGLIYDIIGVDAFDVSMWIEDDKIKIEIIK